MTAVGCARVRLVCLILAVGGVVTVCWGTRGPDRHAVLIPQRWASSGTDYHTTDSLAVCALPDGRVALFATAKDGHYVDRFDAGTGRFMRRHGFRGSGIGQFFTPNGILAVEVPGDGVRTGPVLLVVERDNKRVQAFWPDDGAPAGILCDEELFHPYGAAASHRDGRVFLYVTDSGAILTRRVHLYELSRSGDAVGATYLKSFGAPDGAGALAKAESVAVDDRLGRLLLCDEYEGRQDVKVYSLDGEFTGTTFGHGIFRGEPEGIVLLDIDNDGFVIVTDQRPRSTVWHVFDRTSYTHLASFTGRDWIANTDGICVYPHPLPGFAQGVFMAVHDDRDIRAYALSDIRALDHARPPSTAR